MGYTSNHSAITKAAMVFALGQLGAGNGLNMGTALIGGIAGHKHLSGGTIVYIVLSTA